MNRKLIFLDLICYAAIPYLIWTHGREPLGDYLAILLSTVPGFIYTIYRFIMEKQLNIAGLFIIGSLFISTAVNLLSSSADNMLWNQVYLGFGYVIVYLLSMLFRKPLALYFAVDWAYLQGYRREASKRLYRTRGIFRWFQLLTLLFVVRGIFHNGLKGWLIHTYGADGFGKMLIYMNISGWTFSILITLGFILITVKINNYFKEQNQVQPDTAANDTD
ncbi:hypothetical protein CIL05_18375 [Virgibacillus profundi]|uniref:DUF3159 domain-containing protein n=1 Tax=Virgibacillus profundi TaxID=2024555 RepID=A0A2A2IAA9_9BACI|nr:VC0807 family protein [Virgibacillus profundi]PAV28075.1 hypothetical protein CIL05_18375 [Virgibacillus profundi]PXY52379.1 hypothetical protein CIT14_17820 [Virgibacillus profundi]